MHILLDTILESTHSHFMAFVSPAPLLNAGHFVSIHQRNKGQSLLSKNVSTTIANVNDSGGKSEKNNESSHLHRNTLKAFEAFTWRAQYNLCSTTAYIDGLGTFSPLPNAYSPQTNPKSRSETKRKSYSSSMRTRKMVGGRSFKTAVVSAWRNPPIPSEQSRHRHVTFLHEPSSQVRYITNAAGISIKLEPRSVVIPALRADVNYFEVGDLMGVGWGTWWFSGSVDVVRGEGNTYSEKNKSDKGMVIEREFGGDIGVLHRGWRDLCIKSGEGEWTERDEIARFLESCLDDDEARTFGAQDAVRRATAFGFMSEIVDELLPRYWPIANLQSSKEQEYRRKYTEDAGNTSEDNRRKHSRGRHQSELFQMGGGARLESTFVNSPPFGLWRFTVTPPLRSPAGRVLQRLRDRKSAAFPSMYL